LGALQLVVVLGVLLALGRVSNPFRELGALQPAMHYRLITGD